MVSDFVWIGFEEELAVFGFDVFGGWLRGAEIVVSADGELGEFEFGLHGGVVDSGADGGCGG